MVRAARPIEAHPRNFVNKKFCSENFCSLHVSFILSTSVIVAGLQGMARNERGGRGVVRSFCLKGSPVSWGFKGAERAERKPAGCAKTDANSGAKLYAIKCFAGGGNLRDKCGPMISQHRTIRTNFPLSQSPKFHAVSSMFSLFFRFAHVFFVFPSCSPSFVLLQTVR